MIIALELGKKCLYPSDTGIIFATSSGNNHVCMAPFGNIPIIYIYNIYIYISIKTLIENGINKAKAIPQLELRKTKPKTKEDIITFVSTHNPNKPNMWPLVSTTLSVLKTSQKMEKVLQNTSVINSKRQPHNLKRILTRAKFSTNHTQGGSFKCNDKRCATKY